MTGANIVNPDPILTSDDDNDEEPLMQAHFTLMLSSWLILAPMAIITSWTMRQTLRNNLWFKIHTTANILTFLATLAGIICIFILAGEWVGDQDWASKHCKCGISVFLLVWSNFFLGMARAKFVPEPWESEKFYNKDPYRTPSGTAFRLIHRIFGLAAIGCGYATIYYAIDFWDFPIDDTTSKDNLYVIYFSVIGITLAGAGILTVFDRFGRRSKCIRSLITIIYIGLWVATVGGVSYMISILW